MQVFFSVYSQSPSSFDTYVGSVPVKNDRYSQTWESSKKHSCYCKLHVSIENKNKTEGFSFNLVDIYPASIQYKTLKREVFVEAYTVGKKDFIQKTCLVTFYQTDVSKGDEYTFLFHLEDVDPSRVSLDVKGNNLFVSLVSRSKKDWIEVTKNGDKENFDDNLRIRFSDLESGKGPEIDDSILPTRKIACSPSSTFASCCVY
ncbi:MAG: hypothetical protein AAF694_14615 [Bacteroidota bacterium]